MRFRERSEAVNPCHQIDSDIRTPLMCIVRSESKTWRTLMETVNYDHALRSIKLQQKERSLDSRERRLERLERGLLKDFASVLRKKGCLIYLPGEWPGSTPASEMVEVMNPHPYLHRALKTAYDGGNRDEGLTPKSFSSGELSIEDLSEDLETLDKVLPELRRIGNGTVQQLRHCLKRTGILSKS